jgi:hypothetical protein
LDFILEGLPNSIKDKVGHCSLAKELWDKTKNLYFEESPIKNLESAKEDAGT